MLLNRTEKPPPPEGDPPPGGKSTDTKVKGDEIIFKLGDRRYRVRGLAKNLSYELLKVNLLASKGEGFHVDTLDLYSARQRAVFLKQAAIEMGVKEDIVKRDLGRVLLKLEELQEEAISGPWSRRNRKITIGEAEREAALELLRKPDLLEPHPGRLCPLRRGGRRDEQARRVHRRRVAPSGSATGRGGAVELRRRQKLADGCHPGFRAGRSSACSTRP